MNKSCTLEFFCTAVYFFDKQLWMSDVESDVLIYVGHPSERKEPS